MVIGLNARAGHARALKGGARIRGWMQKVRIYKPPTGVALMEVRKDRSVVLVDLQVVGVKVLRRADPRRYLRQYEVALSTLKALGLQPPKPEGEERLVLKYRGRLILATLIREGGGPLVRYVIFIAFSPGVLAKLARKLESNGWRRAAMLELKPVRSAHHARHSASNTGP